MELAVGLIGQLNISLVCCSMRRGLDPMLLWKDQGQFGYRAFGLDGILQRFLRKDMLVAKH